MHLQQELFTADRLPRKPYCTDELGAGLQIRQLKSAIRKKYIQLNPPKLFFWLVLDIDKAGGAIAWEKANLPMPNFATTNPENAHAHLAWGLEAPVLTTEAAREAPLRYLDSVRRAYTELCEADKGYSGLITKNPLNSAWRTLWGHSHFYDLGELAEYVPDLSKFSRKAGDQMDEVGIGRNVSLFHTVRKWAYVEIRLFRGAGRAHHDVWHKHVLDQVEKRNGDFKEPLPYSEVKATAKSIANFVWKADPSAEAKFRARQSYRGSKGGRPSLGAPWEELGISRATYFRKRKSGLLVPVNK